VTTARKLLACTGFLGAGSLLILASFLQEPLAVVLALGFALIPQLDIMERRNRQKSAFAPWVLFVIATANVYGQNAAPPATSSRPTMLPPPPAPLGVPKPGPATDGPYPPLPILQGGVVIPLYPPGSPFLKMDRVREPEQYNMY